MDSPQRLPEPFLERLSKILPSESIAGCLAAFEQPLSTTFRVNTLRADVGSAIARLTAAGFAVRPLSCPAVEAVSAYSVPDEQRRGLTESEACRKGEIYLQNPSSMIPPLVLDPRGGERVLDLAAAPGGKALQMAAMMGNQGRLAAVEMARSRFFKMKEILSRHGARIAETYLKDGAGVWKNCPEAFDRVLLDAPCSGEGRFRAGERSSYAYWSLRKIREMARKQKRLMFSAVQCLKPGGVLVYATCTMAPEENELVLERILRRFGSALELEEIQLPIANLAPGLTQWRGKELRPEMSRCARILPDAQMEGFFVARIRKTSSTLHPGAAEGEGPVIWP
jgi:NOL1/NOP2/sun family putative RNA methylase